METQELINAGWVQSESSPFSEKVSNGADAYFTYKNASGNLIGLCVFSQNKIMKLRIEEVAANDFRWFQMEYGDKLSELLKAIISEQDSASLSNYFGLYGTLSSVCSTSFLAWEQWEANYR